VKTYLNQLNELDIAFNKKLVEIDKALLLTAGILQGNLKFDFLALSEQRAAERVNMLSEINTELDSNPPAGAKRKGSKSKKKRKDGPSTYEVTQEMVNKGMTVEQIAEDRGLAVGTIEGHFAKLVELGVLPIIRFLQEEEVTEITTAIKELPAEFTSKDLFEKFKGKYGYGKLRAVIANIKNSDQQKS
jgi:uncharacterized protein YpbB